MDKVIADEQDKTLIGSVATPGLAVATPGVAVAFAGRCNVNGHDKIWTAAVLGCEFKSLYGKTGSRYSPADKTFLTPEKALAHYLSKYKSKTDGSGDVYTQVAFNDPLQGNMPFLFSGQGDVGTAIISTPTAMKESVYATAHVLPMDEATLDAALASAAYTVSEKVNGRRCVIARDEAGQITAYNRKGQLLPTPPTAAQRLHAIGHPFVLDGEWMDGAAAQNTYVVFDVLNWKSQDMHPLPYRQRIAVLEATFAGLNIAHAIAPSIDDIRPNSLYLLTGEIDAVEGRALADRVLVRGGEGLIIRTLDAPLIAGNTTDIRKIKYQASVDAFVLRVNPGLATGSVTLGLRRPSDDAIIAICNVRSGLTDADITRIDTLLAAGERPVFEVDYLCARSVTHKIVEPKTSWIKRRTDKLWSECTTDQLGADKASIVAAAPAERVIAAAA